MTFNGIGYSEYFVLADCSIAYSINCVSQITSTTNWKWHFEHVEASLATYSIL